MGMLTAPEIREHHLSPKERAVARDSFVRDFEKQFNDWVGIARCCIEVERDRDYELLGFSSWHSWLIDAAPRSRSYIYLVVGRYKELAPDIPDAELERIPLGSAGVLKKLSSAVRRSPLVREAAKQLPQKFISDLSQIEPMQHVEGVIEKRLKFTVSQWMVIDRALEAYRVVDENATLEEFVEWLVSETSQ